MDIEGKKIILIGGAGLVGSHTLEALLAESIEEVVIYDNFKRGKITNIDHCLHDKRVKLVDVPTDVLRQDVLERHFQGAHAVIHLASLWLTYSQEFPRSAVEENVLGAFNVFDACLRTGIEKVVFASSASVYGNAIQKPMTEQHPFNNTNVYGATKICMEALATALHHSHQLSVIGLRYFNIYGPRQDSRGAYNSVVVKLLDNSERNLPLIIYGDGNQSYDFISVTDIAKANVCALKADTAFGMYNVCTGRSTSINELARIIKAATGSHSTIEYRPNATSFVTDRVGCPIKAEREIDFKASQSLENGIADFAEWRRQPLRASA